MSTARGVFIDLVGTLIELDGGVGYQYARLAERESLDLDPAVVDLEFPQALRCVPLFDWGVDATLEEIALREKISWHGVVARIVNKAHLPQNEPVPEFDAFFKKLFPHFTRADVWKVHEDVVPCLEGLMRDGYVIGLVSNFDLRVFPLLDNLGLSRLFDSVTVPAVAHAAKPSPAIFSFALSRHSLIPEETVYIGDSIDDDVEGARSAGLQPILIDRKEQHGDIASVPRITTLGSLRPLLRSLGTGPEPEPAG
jgi:putative hydrolase of the HAD superfamily